MSERTAIDDDERRRVWLAVYQATFAATYVQGWPAAAEDARRLEALQYNENGIRIEQNRIRWALQTECGDRAREAARMALDDLDLRGWTRHGWRPS